MELRPEALRFWSSKIFQCSQVQKIKQKKNDQQNSHNPIKLKLLWLPQKQLNTVTSISLQSKYNQIYKEGSLTHLYSDSPYTNVKEAYWL